jgi:3',5'-cyclic AMP phosphodiesterase CpdA
MASDTPLVTLMLTSDPQIGLYRAARDRAEANRASLEATGREDPVFDDLPHIEAYERESLLFREMIATANERRPDAVIVCGDVLQDWDSDDQARLALEIADGIDADIPLHWVSGNHDIAPDTYAPAEEALARYREFFGPDRYITVIGPVRLIVINSTAIHSEALPAERAANLEFLEAELAAAKRENQHPVVCSHHPWFLRDVDAVPADPVTAMEMPPGPRRLLLDIAEAGELRTLLTGHLHQHLTRTAGDLLQITTSAIGLPFARHPSGYQLVRIYADRVEHEPHDLPSGPALHDEAKRLWAARQFRPE